MSVPIRIMIRSASPYAPREYQLEDTDELTEQITALGFGPVDVEVVPPAAEAPMASGVGEWLMVYIGGPLAALGVADLHAVCKAWLRKRITKPEKQALRFGKGVIFGPDGEPLRQFQITQRPGGEVLDSEQE